MDMTHKVLRRYLVRQAVERTSDKWKNLPKGWTAKSFEKFWNSLTGKAEHKVTQCIKKMKDHMDDPGAFCSSARDRAEGPGWRSES